MSPKSSPGGSPRRHRGIIEASSTVRDRIYRHRASAIGFSLTVNFLIAPPCTPHAPVNTVKRLRVRLALAHWAHMCTLNSQISRLSVLDDSLRFRAYIERRGSPLWPSGHWGVDSERLKSEPLCVVRTRREKNGARSGGERGKTVSTETREGEDLIDDRCVGGHTCEPKPSAARWWRAARECGMVRQHGAMVTWSVLPRSGAGPPVLCCV